MYKKIIFCAELKYNYFLTQYPLYITNIPLRKGGGYIIHDFSRISGSNILTEQHKTQTAETKTTNKNVLAYKQELPTIY